MKQTPSLIDMSPKRFCHALSGLLRQLPSRPPAAAPAPAGKNADATVALLQSRLPQRLLDDLAAEVAAPVQVVSNQHCRVVVVLRLYAMAFDRATGLARAAQLREDDGGLVALETPVPSVRLLHSPQGPDWHRLWLAGWLRRHGHPYESPAQMEALNDAAQRLGRLALRSLDLRGMRRTIAQAMAWDPVHWRRAVRLAHAASREPYHHDFNAAIRFAAQLDVLEREAPHLAAPWFALAAAGELEPEREPAAALKQWVKKHTGNERAWKSLVASPARAWMAWGRRAGDGPASHLRDTALLVKQFATAEPVPLPLLRLATSRLDPNVSVDTEIRRGRMRHYPFALRAAKEAIGRGAWNEFAAQFEQVDAWFYAEPPELDKLQRRRGWPWLARKAAAWAEMQRRRQQAREALIPELPPVAVGGYVFHAARTPFDLWMAGERLHNCLGAPEYAEAIAHGKALLLLATRSRDGRLVAAALLRSDGGGLRIAAARGFANGPAPREVIRPLQRALAHFEAVRRARLLPWNIGRPEPRPQPLAACALPVPIDPEATDLLLASDGSVRLGRWAADYSVPGVGRRFVTARIVRGGQAQRLADHATARFGAPVETLDALAAAIAAALAAAPGYEHWLTAFGATAPDPESVVEKGAGTACATPPGTDTDGDAIDLDFRPASYFAPRPAAEEVLLRIRGTVRRQEAQRLLAEGADPAEVERLTDAAQPPGLGDRLMAIHPSLSGGEYLPDALPGEVEIARVELVGSVLGDVISVRARPEGEAIVYRIVDEYDSDFAPAIARSEQPLSMRELIVLIERSDPALGIADLQWRIDCGHDPGKLRRFMRIGSTFYPRLGDWYEREIESFLQAQARQKADDDDKE